MKSEEEIKSRHKAMNKNQKTFTERNRGHFEALEWVLEQ